MHRHTAPSTLVAVSIATFGLASAVGTAYAQSEAWHVARASGQAWMSSEGEAPVVLAAGMDLPSGATLSTGAGARIMLVRGAETMMVGPKSVIAVSEHPTEGLTTTILEKAGEVQFDVEKQNVHYFSVETPMLAAVVKGTHFTVGVGRANGAVKVARGTVEVTALATGEVSDVTAGQHARVGARGMSVGGVGHPSISVGQPRASVVSAMTSPAPTVSPTAPFSTAELSAVATVAAPADVSATVSNQAAATSHADHTSSSARSTVNAAPSVATVSTASLNASVGAASSALGMALSTSPTTSTGVGASSGHASPAQTTAAAPPGPAKAAVATKPSIATPAAPNATPGVKAHGIGFGLGLNGGLIGKALGALANAARGVVSNGGNQSGVGGLGGLGAGAFGRGR